jgi:plasmid stability protein
VNLTIKNVPSTIHRQLKRDAAEHGRSLNAKIIQVLAAEAAELDRRRKMRESRADLEKFVAGLPKVPSSVPLIRADRKRH